MDILFTDVNLPGGMDGMMLARRAREMQPDLPVVYASGHANMFDLERHACRVRFSLPSLTFRSLVGRLLAAAMKGGSTRDGRRRPLRGPSASA